MRATQKIKTNSSQLHLDVLKLGTDVVNCTNGKNCPACKCNSKNRKSAGIIPHGIYLEKCNSYRKYIVIVGLNRGGSSFLERQTLKKSGSYKNTVKFWNQNIQNWHPYYVKLRRLAKKTAMVRGSLYWTELVKGEWIYKGTKKGWTKTISECSKLFLESELSML